MIVNIFHRQPLLLAADFFASTVTAPIHAEVHSLKFDSVEHSSPVLELMTANKLKSSELFLGLKRDVSDVHARWDIPMSKISNVMASGYALFCVRQASATDFK